MAEEWHQMTLDELLNTPGVIIDSIEIETEGPDPLMAKLTDDDMSAFMSGAKKRKTGPEVGGGKAAFGEYLRLNRMRVWALKRDLRWFLKEAQKRGIAPDEAMKMLLTDG